MGPWGSGTAQETEGQRVGAAGVLGWSFFMTSLSSATAPTAKEKTGIGTQSGQEGGSIGGLLMCQANHPAYRQHPGLKVTAGKPCFSGFSSSQD